MTATRQGLATVSGYGATSEFGGSTSDPQSSDMSLTKTLLNPEDVAIGATLTYEFVVTNNGPDAVDLGLFDGADVGVNNIALDIMPPDITFLTADGTDISCSSAGPGSVSGFGSVLANHSDHEGVFCGYTGGNQLLGVGDSISFTMDVQVQPSSDLVFTNIAYIGSVPSSDPDEPAFGAAFFSGNDFIDYLGTSVNNVAYATYPIPVTPPNPANTSPVSTSPLALLGKTGEIVTSWYGLVGVSVSLAGFVYIKKFQGRKKVYRL
jgi:LPXTG-motif cell wall-anchored protein